MNVFHGAAAVVLRIERSLFVTGTLNHSFYRRSWRWCSMTFLISSVGVGKHEGGRRESSLAVVFGP